jgi:hypothetical protein
VKGVDKVLDIYVELKGMNLGDELPLIVKSIEGRSPTLVSVAGIEVDTLALISVLETVRERTSSGEFAG